MKNALDIPPLVLAAHPKGYEQKENFFASAVLPPTTVSFTFNSKIPTLISAPQGMK